MIVDHSNGRVLDILPSRDKESVVQYLRQKKEAGLLASVTEVTCDMWDAYANAATEVFGTSVLVTIDRFHVMKNFQEQLTKARRELQRGLGKEDAKALQGTRWLWVKNWENLSDEERGQLESLKQRYPKLKQLAEQREELRALFEDRSINSSAEGKRRLEAWMGAAIPGSGVGEWVSEQPISYRSVVGHEASPVSPSPRLSGGLQRRAAPCQNLGNAALPRAWLDRCAPSTRGGLLSCLTAHSPCSC